MGSGKRYYWLKLKEDFFSSKRIKKLRKLAGGDTFTIIYLKMQLLAMKSDGVLQWTGLEQDFASELALDIDEDVENVKVTLAYLLSCGLAESSDSINFLFPYAVENVGSEGSSAQRMRDVRANLKAAEQAMLESGKGSPPSEDAQSRTMCAHRDGEKETENRDRGEIKEEDISVSTETVRLTQSVRRVVDEWNELKDVGIRQVSRLESGSKRYQCLVARINQYGIDSVLEAVRLIRESDFLQGKSKNGWTITFDWFVLPNNFPKVLEGQYSNRSQTQNRSEPQSSASAMLNLMRRGEFGDS